MSEKPTRHVDPTLGTTEAGVDDPEPTWWKRRWTAFRVPIRYRKFIWRIAIGLIVLIAAVAVSAVTIDLGPAVREQAERFISERLDRPVRIGRLGSYIVPGRFLIQDLVVEGLEPTDEPFFTSEHMVISTSWLPLFHGEILVDNIDVRGWRMLSESFPDGRESFPSIVGGSDDVDTGAVGDQVTGEGPVADSPRRIVTTVQYFHAYEGEFVYRNHSEPWSITARDIDLTVENRDIYSGEVSFRGGTVEIHDFKPMTVDMEASYDLDGGDVTLADIALSLDGFQSTLTGEIDLLAWPEQTYHIIDSNIDLPIMKDIFFADDPFTVSGEARLAGMWHIFDGGRELTGSFVSSNWVLNDFVFPDTKASLLWTDDRFEVFDYTSGFYGGTLDLRYALAPLGSGDLGVATLDTTVANVDLAALTGAIDVIGIRPDGSVRGRNILRWPVGQFRHYAGEGHFTVTPPEGVQVLTDALPRASVSGMESPAGVQFDPLGEPWRTSIGGELHYTVNPEWVEIAPSRLATSTTRIEFEGRTAFGDRSRIPFHVMSGDWQESDRLMAAVLTAFGNPTNEISVRGRGELRGVMLGSFATPRIEALFDGDDIFAWNVDWGIGAGRIVVENAYLEVADGVFNQGDSLMRVDGRFSLGFSRADGGEEINARFVLNAFPSEQLRNIFSLEGYEVNGPLTGEIRLNGQYDRPFGMGGLTMAQPVVWGEPFDLATARLRFEGNGVRLDGLQMHKGDGELTGAMFIRWNETYSFNLDGRDLALAAIESLRGELVPVSGQAQFTVTGAGAFDEPRYQVHGTVSDFGVRGETVGQVTGRADVANGVMRVAVEAASPDLAISGSGRIELEGNNTADLSFRLTNTVINPFVRAYTTEFPSDVSAVVSGTLQLVGPIREVDAITMDATVEQLQLDLFEYAVRNDGLVRFSLDDYVVHVNQMKLVGEGTSLELTGLIDLRDQHVELRANGDTNLAVLQAFFPDIRSSGSAQLLADIGGTISRPVIVGTASVASGRIRHFSLPHALDELEGRVTFEPDGVRFHRLTGMLAGGPIQFGGRVGIGGYEIGELNITAEATGMKLRFPEGMRSVVDAELTLGGDLEDIVLSGTAIVRDAIWLDLFEPTTGWLDFTSQGGTLAPQTVESTLPLRYDIRVLAPSTLRISDSAARIVASAEFALSGTYDQPLMYGNAEIDRGEVFFEGNRYRVTRGSITFSDPTKLDPYLDIELETDIRVPSETYRVTFGVTGTMDRLDIELSSDPPLQDSEIVSLLLGDIRDPQAAEIRSLRAQEQARQELLQVGAARLLTNPLSSVVEESFGVDSFEIVPALSDPSAQQATQFRPTARVLIGKRISDRAHVTFSRAVSGANQDLLVVLEYDQNDRLSWIFSQNADRTYAVDFRVRHVF